MSHVFVALCDLLMFDISIALTTTPPSTINFCCLVIYLFMCRNRYDEIEYDLMHCYFPLSFSFVCITRTVCCVARMRPLVVKRLLCVYGVYYMWNDSQCNNECLIWYNNDNSVQALKHTHIELMGEKSQHNNNSNNKSRSSKRCTRARVSNICDVFQWSTAMYIYRIQWMWVEYALCCDAVGLNVTYMQAMRWMYVFGL